MVSQLQIRRKANIRAKIPNIRRKRILQWISITKAACMPSFIVRTTSDNTLQLLCSKFYETDSALINREVSKSSPHYPVCQQRYIIKNWNKDHHLRQRPKQYVTLLTRQRRVLSYLSTNSVPNVQPSNISEDHIILNRSKPLFLSSCTKYNLKSLKRRFELQIRSKKSSIYFLDKIFHLLFSLYNIYESFKIMQVVRRPYPYFLFTKAMLSLHLKLKFLFGFVFFIELPLMEVLPSPKAQRWYWGKPPTKAGSQRHIQAQIHNSTSSSQR